MPAPKPNSRPRSRHAAISLDAASRIASAIKGIALILGLILILSVWFWDASLLTEAADQNLHLIREATRLLPDAWSSRVESALRIFGADRALLLTEAVAVAKLIS